MAFITQYAKFKFRKKQFYIGKNTTTLAKRNWHGLTYLRDRSQKSESHYQQIGGALNRNSRARF
ncbi:hypothetical protein VYA_40760 [Vibrio alfacsensis]|nr:hypothetical protein VYA_40760 [Vibrio alfacsensis]